MVSERHSLAIQPDSTVLPPSFFIHTIADLQKLLVHLHRSSFGGVADGHWRVEAEEIQVIASPNGVASDVLLRIMADAHEGLRAAEEGSNWPASFDDEARAIATGLVRRFHRVTGAVVETPGHEPVNIELGTTPREKKSSRRYTAWDSIDGWLYIVSVRRQPHFVIDEHGSNNRIRCQFPDDWIQKVALLLRKRVLVEGFVRYRDNGEPYLLSNPTEMLLVEEPEHSVDDLLGSIPRLTENLSSYEFVRQLRTGEVGGVENTGIPACS